MRFDVHLISYRIHGVGTLPGTQRFAGEPWLSPPFHHCDFCYKDAFFLGGRSFYTQRVDRALAEIESLTGRHLYFLDDHLLGHPYFADQLFEGMRGMGRLFQGAARPLLETLLMTHQKSAPHPTDSRHCVPAKRGAGLD
jgi:hypothetical protein